MVYAINRLKEVEKSGEPKQSAAYTVESLIAIDELHSQVSLWGFNVRLTFDFYLKEISVQGISSMNFPQNCFRTDMSGLYFISKAPCTVPVISASPQGCIISRDLPGRFWVA